MRCLDAGWSSLAARRAHNPKVVGSNPAPATNCLQVRYDPAVCGVLCFRWVGEVAARWAKGPFFVAAVPRI